MKELDHVQETLGSVKRNLTNMAWFKKGKWLVATHPFPSVRPEAITLHVYKNSWFNEDRTGIHFETFLALEPGKRKKSYVALHVLHEGIVPGTRLKRTAITKPLVDTVYPTVKTWPGYKFRVGKYGLQPFSREIDGDAPDYAHQVMLELTRLCRLVGPQIDHVIKGLKL